MTMQFDEIKTWTKMTNGRFEPDHNPIEYSIALCKGEPPEVISPTIFFTEVLKNVRAGFTIDYVKTEYDEIQWIRVKRYEYNENVSKLEENIMTKSFNDDPDDEYSFYLYVSTEEDGLKSVSFIEPVFTNKHWVYFEVRGTAEF